MNLTMTVNPWEDESLIFAQQMSVTHILAQAILPEWSDGTWNRKVMSAIRNRVEQAGFILVGLASLPVSIDRSVLGAAGWEEESAATSAFLREAGAAGIPLVCFHWQTSAARPASRSANGRGNVKVRSLPHSPTATPTNNGSCDRLLRFCEDTLPETRQAGVRMAFSPSSDLTTTDIIKGDFPASLEDIQAFFNQTPPELGLDFNTGIMFDLLGNNAKPQDQLVDALRWFYEKGRLSILTAANRVLQNDISREAFLDEGDMNIPYILQALTRMDYQGAIRADTQPGIDVDSSWGHKAQAYTTGYLRAVLQAIGGR